MHSVMSYTGNLLYVSYTILACFYFIFRQGRPLPTDIADKLSAIDNALSSHESLSVDLRCGIERLRSAVSFLTDNTTDIDSIG
jgi:hypothetical protein